MSTLAGVRDFSAQGCWQDTVQVAGKVGAAISEGASKVGTMIYNGGSHVVVWLRDSGASALGWIKERGTGVVTWGRDGVAAVKDHTYYVAKAIKDGAATGIRWTFDTAYKTWEYARPQLAAFGAASKQFIVDTYRSARTFAHAHPEGITGFAIGVVVVLAIRGMMTW